VALDAEKLRSLLGLALRARKLGVGRAACRQAVRDRRLHLLLVARDAGASAVRDAAGGNEVTCVHVDLDKQQLGGLVGRTAVAILGILDPHVASGLLQLVRAAEGSRPTS